MSLRKKILSVTVISNLALLLVSAVYSFLTVTHARAGSEFIPCFVKNSLHFYCPGCGGSRSVVALFELDFLKSLIYFPATLYTVALLINCDILAIIAAVRNSEESLRKITAKPFLLIPVIVMLNFIVRNILLILGIDYIGDLR